MIPPRHEEQQEISIEHLLWRPLQLRQFAVVLDPKADSSRRKRITQPVFYLLSEFWSNIQRVKNTTHSLRHKLVRSRQNFCLLDHICVVIASKHIRLLDTMRQ